MLTGKQKTISNRLLGLCGTLLIVSGCTTSPSRYSQRHDSAPSRLVDVSAIPDAVPRAEPLSRYGNPDSYVVQGRRYHTLGSPSGYKQRGVASWYGTKFHGHRTSSGEPYDMYQMTAAHKTLPLPSYARVTNLRNGRSVIVKINDRGPFHENRLIDLSYAAAARLDILKHGTGLVEVETIDASEPEPAATRTAAYKTHSGSPSQPKTAAPVEPPALYLQLGAFAERRNAERLRTTLASARIDGLHISEGLSEATPVYRVRIGPLASVEAADALVQSLHAQGLGPVHLVVVEGH